ncbi:hypothetical protein HNQ38_001446 [Desulfovibrio intestinalis]|uniref:Uncharacterized protein n=1 Tax=Desulfovibrio intestinalis TaxID=58621 RepID=A0A7W8C2U4_9BACT|nr:hypothetical protein [Desulfovibrio intestinalis]
MALRGTQGDHPTGGREAPEAITAQPSLIGDTWKTPGGVVRGECRGGLGGAAAPNRPPSAARRAGGPNNINGKAPVPAGHTLRKIKTCGSNTESPRARATSLAKRSSSLSPSHSARPPCPRAQLPALIQQKGSHRLLPVAPVILRLFAMQHPQKRLAAALINCIPR